MVANGGTDAYAPQSSLVRWVLRGVGGSALLAAYFLNIILYRTSNRNRTLPRDFRPIQPPVSIFAKIHDFSISGLFFMNFIPEIQLY
jgi:hypothetical protein